MTARFEFDGMGPSDLAASLEALPGALNDSLEGAAQDIAERIEGQAKQNAPVDRGAGGGLISRIESVVEAVGETLIEIRVGSNADQAAPMEYGTDPFFPPPSELRGWARRVLGADDPETAAFLVARKISETGIDAQPYLRPAFEENLEWALDRINDAVTEAFGDVGFDV